jgi:hypothetical protein
MICDDSPPRLTLDRDGIGMGNVECDTGAGLGRFGSPTSSVIQTSEYEEQSAAVSK